MSIYNKPDLNSKLGSVTPSYIHKKTNSLNFGSNTGRFLQENNNKLSKKKLELNQNQGNNTENNINQNINKLLTSTNKANKKFEINVNKNYSPITKLNKTNRENIILLKHKQSTSSSNLNNKNCNIIINNNIDTNPNLKEKYPKNNNINININISKKIIYKQKDKKNLIVVKNQNQLNSANNNHTKLNQENFNKLKKENKSMFLSQIQLPINSSVSPRNVNNVNNFIKLNQGKHSVNKSRKNQNSKNNNQKLSANNINYIHNNTEYNIYEKMNNNIANNDDNYKTEKNSPIKSIFINKKKDLKNKIFEINVDCPEELHFFYINIFQKGNKINFEKNSNH